jgi:hypothetical protein
MLNIRDILKLRRNQSSKLDEATKQHFLEGLKKNLKKSYYDLNKISEEEKQKIINNVKSIESEYLIDENENNQIVNQDLDNEVTSTDIEDEPLNNLYGVSKNMPCATLVTNILQYETEQIPCVSLIQSIKRSNLGEKPCSILIGIIERNERPVMPCSILIDIIERNERPVMPCKKLIDLITREG